MKAPQRITARRPSRRTALDDALEKLTKLAERRRASPIEMGRILATVTGADRDAAAGHIGLSRRAAYYLATIAKAVEAGLIAEKDAITLGWTRARALAAQALGTDRKVPAAAVRWAQGASAREVAAGKPSTGAAMEVMDFALTPRQAAIVRKALDLEGASRGAGPVARAKALASICRRVIDGSVGARRNVPVTKR